LSPVANTSGCGRWSEEAEGGGVGAEVGDWIVGREGGDGAVLGVKM